MQIEAQTKISTIIKANEKSIDAIAALTKPLEKLRNPLLRKIMASRVTVAEAAKVGGCTVADFAKALAPLGFEFVGGRSEIESEEIKKPDWLKKASTGDIVEFDVREILSGGKDPLRDIMAKFKEVPEGKILCIINSFVPTPLIHLLAKERGALSYVDEKSSDLSHTYFLKPSDEPVTIPASADKVIMDDADSFEQVHQRFSGSTKEIDVRHLEMPGPMQTILAELESLPTGNALYIHHKRVPVYLLEELADKNYEVHIHNIEEGNVKMMIFKNDLTT